MLRQWALEPITLDYLGFKFSFLICKTAIKYLPNCSSKNSSYWALIMIPSTCMVPMYKREFLFPRILIFSHPVSSNRKPCSCLLKVGCLPSPIHFTNPISESGEMSKLQTLPRPAPTPTLSLHTPPCPPPQSFPAVTLGCFSISHH